MLIVVELALILGNRCIITAFVNLIGTVVGRPSSIITTDRCIVVLRISLISSEVSCNRCCVRIISSVSICDLFLINTDDLSNLLFPCRNCCDIVFKVAISCWCAVRLLGNNPVPKNTRICRLTVDGSATIGAGISSTGVKLGRAGKAGIVTFGFVSVGGVGALGRLIVGGVGGVGKSRLGAVGTSGSCPSTGGVGGVGAVGRVNFGALASVGRSSAGGMGIAGKLRLGGVGTDGIVKLGMVGGVGKLRLGTLGAGSKVPRVGDVGASGAVGSVVTAGG